MLFDDDYNSYYDVCDYDDVLYVLFSRFPPTVFSAKSKKGG